MRAWALLLGLLAASPARAQPRSGDAVVFARDGALWRIPARGGTADKVLDLDERARAVAGLEASADGATVLVRAGAARRWVRLADGDSRAIVCGTNGATAPAAPLRELAWDGSRVGCPLDADTDIVVDAGGRHHTEAVASRTSWMVSPDGGRAVAVEDGALVTFRLDQRMARRVLLAGATPLAWSADGNWVLAELGTQACIVRAVGGEYKCWSGYTGLALAGDGGYALLRRPAGDHFDLFVAELAGAHKESPRVLQRRVDGAATWLTLPGEDGPPADGDAPVTPEEAGE